MEDMMRLTLRNKADLWSLPGKVHLSFESREADISPELLSDNDIKTIGMAIRNGYIHVDNLDFINKRLQVQPAVPEKTTIPVIQNPSIETLRKQAKETCIALLKQDITAIKNVVEKSTDLVFLRELLALEESGKNRKSVASSIRSRLETQWKAIKQSVGDKEVAFSNPDNDGLEVTEELEESITVNFATPQEN